MKYTRIKNIDQMIKVKQNKNIGQKHNVGFPNRMFRENENNILSIES